jgi:hypothetical protein
MPIFKSELGNALFPREDDFYSRELNSLVGEILESCKKKDYQEDITGIGKTLSTFIPVKVLCSGSGYWRKRNQDRWENELKPILIEVFEEYFINGGKQKELSIIEECLLDLENIGVVIQGKNKLIQDLSKGNWRKKLIKWSEMGKPEGVTFVCESPIKIIEIEKILKRSKIEDQLISRFINAGIRVHIGSMSDHKRIKKSSIVMKIKNCFLCFFKNNV